MKKISNGNTMLPPTTTSDKNKDWQLELLMEKLRSKATQFKSFPETSKNVRMSMLDKRYALDSVEKSQHQKCLDTLQQSIKVTSLQRMVEKLECLTRQLGLKFMVGSSGVELFISSDMFYLEINLDQNGTVKDVKVHHGSSKAEQSCAELVSCLSRGDFADFTAQLEGFASIYQLNAEKNIKCKAYTALQSLEADLSTLAQLQTFMKEPFNLLHKSPVGILEKRRGGHPMKLTYFVSPYDLIDVDKFDIDPITIEAVTSKLLGYSVTVCMEGSAAHKLQTTTLITVNRNINGKNSPSFTSLSSQNSAAIPACFVLKLNKPMPMCVALVRQIQQVTELECAELSNSTHPLLSLIATHASSGKFEGEVSKGMFVTLPDQQHCYFLTENKNLEGVLVHSIPFTHPAHVSQILIILRQQALFNTIIASCVRLNSKQDLENMIVFEVSALSWTHISISLEHPVEETIATAEIDLTDISNLVCRMHSPGTPPPPNTPDTASDLATKVLNRSFSIPITMRSVIKLWDKQAVRKSHFNGHENFSLALGSDDPGGHNGPSGDGLTEFGGLDGKIKQEPPGNSGLGHGINLPMMSHPHENMFLDEQSILSNMELTNILQGTSQQSEKISRRSQKRKAGEDPWRSSKHRMGDDSELLETSSSDSTSRSTPLSQETVSEIQTPNSVLGFHSDLELSGLDPTEFIGNAEKTSDYEGMDDIGEMEEILTGKSSRKLKSPSNTNMLVDLGDGKGIVPPSVSITPIPTSSGFAQGGSGGGSRPGIEIIPISSPSTVLPSSITITPISSSQIKSEERREKKSSKSRSEDKNRLEKKRRKKKEESSMGPPEKLPLKQDPLSKPVTVSIKATDTVPIPSLSPTSPNMMRKFSPSPTHNRSLSGKLSPNLLKPGFKTSASPKHSPIHIPSSPKHMVAGISSPKNHGTSPKHPSTSGSGKPSMSTLKNAANSPSGKSSGDKSKSLSKERREEKEKKQIFGVGGSPKVKSSLVKLKQLDLNEGLDVPQDSAQLDLSKSNPNQVRNRKGSLSAVIDKLKSAQHCDLITDLMTKSSSNRERSQMTNKGSDNTKSTTTKNSEYMVKPSSDGMKITINKTRMKESSKASFSSNKLSMSGTGSPKTHTGLKPGVNSGPASKKPQQQTGQKSTATSVSNSNYLTYKSASKLSPSGKTSGGSVTLNKTLGKMSGSPKMNSSITDLSRGKERPKSNKSSEKNIFSSREGRKSSPTQLREETESQYKMAMMKMDPLLMEGRKPLENYQIPRLSDKQKNLKVNTTIADLNNVTRDGNKVFDMMKNDSTITKYPVALPMSNADLKMRTNPNNMLPGGPLALTTSPKLNQMSQQKEDFEKKDVPQNLSNQSAKDFSLTKTYAEPLSLSVKSVDLTSKFVAPAPKDEKKESKIKSESSDGLLDFSTKGEHKSSPFPQSPSVSVHIVKSPAPSPLISQSPHSASPCITDDELMDEALVGLGK